MFRRSCLSLLVVAVMAAAMATQASANGRMPLSVKVGFRPGNTNDIFLGVTFGLIVTRDNGVTWRWICEGAIPFEGTFDPDYEFAADGSIWATTFDGLRVTRDGCEWTDTQQLGTSLVTAIEISGTGALYAGFADPVLGSAMHKSVDNGVTFQLTANLNQEVDWFDSIETAPSAPDRVYVAAYDLRNGLPPLNLLFRSMNGGTSWEQLPTTAFAFTDVSGLQIAAVSPTNPDLVFVRATLTRSTIGEAIYRTDNWSRPLNMGGPTWTKVLDLPDYITGVAVRQNGEVFASTTITGLQKSTDGGLTFTAVNGVTYEGRCIVERPSDQSLWMCANHLPPQFMALGSSNDGNSWMSKLQYSNLAGPVRCQPGTQQHDDCERNQWCMTVEQVGVTTDEISCAVDAGVDGPGGPPPKDGCCNSSTTPGGGAGIGFIVLVFLGRRRRRCYAD